MKREDQTASISPVLPSFAKPGDLLVAIIIKDDNSSTADYYHTKVEPDGSVAGWTFNGRADIGGRSE